MRQHWCTHSSETYCIPPYEDKTERERGGVWMQSGGMRTERRLWSKEDGGIIGELDEYQKRKEAGDGERGQWCHAVW